MNIANARVATGTSLPDRAQIRELLQRYGWNTMACQILTPGITYWVAPTGNAVVGYVAAGRNWVVAGAPVCPPETLAATALAFEAAAFHQGRRVFYFGAQEQFVQALAERRTQARLLLGAQPVWDPHNWPDIVAHKASLRAQIARAHNKGVTIIPVAAALAAQDPELRRCLAEWLSTRGLPPMHFLTTANLLEARDDQQVLVARRGTAVIGYLIAVPIPQRNGWLIEQIVRDHAAPNGTAELLIDTAMRRFAARGASYLTLGLAPLSSHAPNDTPSPLLIRALLAWMRACGQRYYNFAGLDAFKAKLQPDYWEPVYMLSPERQTSIRTLYTITKVFGGAAPPTFLSYALLRVTIQELQRIRRWFHQAWHHKEGESGTHAKKGVDLRLSPKAGHQRPSDNRPDDG